MFWRGREKEVKEHNGGLPCGQVRVLVVGDSGEFILMLMALPFGFSSECSACLVWENLRGWDWFHELIMG